MIKIELTLRDNIGTSGSRSLRGDKLIPVVIYGGKTPAVSASMTALALKTELDKTINLRTEVYQAKINKQVETLMIKDIQYDNISSKPLHVDFIRVTPDKTVTLSLPIKLTNMDKSESLKQGCKD